MTIRTLLCAAVVCAAAAAQSNDFQPLQPLNKELPEWLRFSGEYRMRMEGIAGIGFKPDSNDLYALNRVRLNLTIRPAPWVKFFVQGQDARVFGRDIGAAVPPYQDTADIRQGFIEIGDTEKTHFALRAGRQEINFGEQRLVGSSNWTNTARTFDAVRGTIRGTAGRAVLRLDVFAASVVNVKSGEWNHHQQGNNLHGLYGGIEKLVPNAVIEPFLLWRVAPWFASAVMETGGRANLNFATAGVRWTGKLPGHFDYATEMAKQFGSLGTDDINTWAGHWRLGYTIANARFTPRVVAEYNYATGDADPRDGKRGTFDSLYPTSHDKYGLADQVGWRNIHDIRTGVELKPTPKWLVSTFFHDWWLASARDALYSASGAAIARVASGAAGRHVGEELDAQASYTFRKQLQLAGGAGHIFPGEFLEKATPGHSLTFTYLSANYTF